MRFNKLIILMVVIAAVFSCDDYATSGESLGGTGQGGSMTRFAINGNYMYIADRTDVKVFNITNGHFQQVNEVQVGIGIETIFAKGDYLYFGAIDAMYIYSIADAEHPSFVFRYEHIVSCDPVVVQGNRAYITLRGGTDCNRIDNALEIIDITDPYEPVLVRSYPMEAPRGLSVDGKLLFVCESESGLKVFDTTNEHNIELLIHNDDFFAYDIIAREGLATVTGEDGIFQFSYNSDGSVFTLLSKIPVTRAEF